MCPTNSARSKVSPCSPPPRRLLWSTTFPWRIRCCRLACRRHHRRAAPPSPTRARRWAEGAAWAAAGGRGGGGRRVCYLPLVSSGPRNLLPPTAPAGRLPPPNHLLSRQRWYRAHASRRSSVTSGCGTRANASVRVTCAREKKSEAHSHHVTFLQHGRVAQSRRRSPQKLDRESAAKKSVNGRKKP